MEVIILPTAADVGDLAADKIASVVADRPTAVIGLATGSSPADIYANLAHRVQQGRLSFARATAFALDEYVGIPIDHPASYAQVISKHVVEPLGFEREQVHVPDGRAADLADAARDFEEAIASAGGIDLQILGIGANGHIGFNEPTSSFASRTRLKTLASRTREDNARFFSDVSEVPMYCLTQGLGTILEARELLLVAQGEAKSEAVALAIEGPLSSMVPASALQLHPHATVIVDEDAASRLRLVEYYRHTYKNKPAWQRFSAPASRDA
jgi:glucosamine-6-phosphate deaminase